MDIPYLQERQLASLNRAQFEVERCARSAHVGMARLYASMIERLERERDHPSGES